MTEQPTPMKNSDDSGKTTNDLRDAAKLAREIFESNHRDESDSLETLSGEEPIGAETSVLPKDTGDEMGNTTNDLIQEAFKALQLEQQARELEEKLQQTAPRATFDPAAMHLVLYVMETHNKMIKVVDHDLIVGRADSVTDYTPDIDLTPFGAYRLGLSRQHATIYAHDHKLLVKDLSSRNGTFVNGTAVPSGGALPLHEGDVVRFGNLSLRISFLNINE
ncbi:MAG: FHA domain-containing protein [Anaerolineae bacterium]|nr:FHA domain-containing protein [Anaerolineae bacterium]